MIRSTEKHKGNLNSGESWGGLSSELSDGYLDNLYFALCEIPDGIRSAYSFLVKGEPVLHLYDTIA